MCRSPMSDDDLLTYILDRFHSSHRSFSSSIWICACTYSLSLEELHILLICEKINLMEETFMKSPIAFIVSRPIKTSNLGHGFAHCGNI